MILFHLKQTETSIHRSPTCAVLPHSLQWPSVKEAVNYGIICHLHKDPLNGCNYKGITLLNMVYKIFSTTLYMLLPFIEREIGTYQSVLERGNLQ